MKVPRQISRPFGLLGAVPERRPLAAAAAAAAAWRPPRGCRSFTPPAAPAHKTLGRPKKPPKAPLAVIPRVGNRLAKLTNVEVDGRFVSFDNIFLRDACACPRCVDPSTRQKLFQTADIPNTVMPRAVHAVGPAGTLLVDGWEDDIPAAAAAAAGPEPHVSVYDIAFLRKYAEMRYRLRHNYNDRRHVLWDARLMAQDMLWVDYEDYMASDLKLYEAVTHLSLYGLLFLRGVPETPSQSAVEGIAQRIGNIKNTFYGSTWDVKPTPNSKNIAYTSLNLGLHMDLLYFESPPGLQFLHCIRPSPTGGASLFADAFRAATAVRMASELQFRSLCSFPVTFHYRNDGHHYHYTRPTVVLESQTYMQHPRIAHVNWAPPFQAPYESGIHVEENAAFRQYLAGTRAFAGSLEDAASVFEVALKEGECAVFANRRVVHGRREFEGEGRWLKGTYVDQDAYLSAFRVLSERFSGAKEGFSGE